MLLRNSQIAMGILSAVCARECPVYAEPATPPPNFVIIFIDDLGYGDPSCYGGEWVSTPAMDRLAAEGVRATAGYVTSPNCAPSRHGLMTGAYQQRFGVESNTDSFENMPGVRVPRSHQMLPGAMQQAGYVTGHVGVWNLTTDLRIWFDEVYSPITFGADYFPDDTGHYPGVSRRTRWDRGARDWGFGPVDPEDEYLTDRLGRESVAFIENHASQPFFLYVATNAVHSPLHAKEEHWDAVAHIESEPLQVYAAMLLSLDENIGRILDALDRTGVADNTLVFLASDNGPSGPLQDGWLDHWDDDLTLGSAGPFSGRKGTFNEGGIRIPYILRWPGVLPAGVTFDAPVSTLDIYPTFAAAAAYTVPQETILDGVNLLPYLRGEAPGAPDRKLFWLGSGRARGGVRMGDWKLLVSSSSSPPTLHDLIADPAEAVDLTSQYPALWAELYTDWVNFQKGLPPSFESRYALQQAAYQEILARGPRALHELDPDDELTVEPGLDSYQALIANPPDGGAGPALWFKSAREPNHGSAGPLAIVDGQPLTDAREDLFGNPQGAFGLAAGSAGGAAVSGSAGTPFGAGEKGAVLLTFRTGEDVFTLASVIAKGTFPDTDPMEVNIYQGFLRLNYRSGAGTKTAHRMLRVTSNTWYTIAVSWDLARPTNPLAWMVGDMDAGLIDQGFLSPYSVGTQEQPFRVAGRTTSSNPFFGSLQNLVVYDRPLDGDTLRQLFSAIVPR
jgi:arylsulfatase A-like enzyme